MKRFAALLALGLLAGCLSNAQKAAVTTDQQKAVYAIDGTYTTAVVAASTYASLPFCTAAAPLSITHACADRAVVQKLAAGAKAASAAVDTLESTVRSNPAADITSALSDAWVLVNTYTQLVSSLK